MTYQRIEPLISVKTRSLLFCDVEILLTENNGRNVILGTKHEFIGNYERSTSVNIFE